MNKISQTASNRGTIIRKLYIGIAAPALLAVLVIVAYSNYSSNIYIVQAKYLMPDDFMAISGNLINEDTVVNKGQIHILGDFVNNGHFTCGDCNSGSIYLEGIGSTKQAIKGNSPPQFRDGVLSNDQGLQLDNKLIITNSFLFNKGIIHSDKADTSLYLHFMTEAIYINADNDQHVNGYVAMSGAGMFVLPTGDGKQLKGIGIQSASKNAFFKGAYFNHSPNVKGLLLGGPFPIDQFNKQTLLHIHNKEFWDLDGEEATSISLFWNESSEIDAWLKHSDSMVVVGWNGNEWENLGQTQFSGSLSEGSIRSVSLVPNRYKAFTLGKSTTIYSEEEVGWVSIDAVESYRDVYLTWNIIESPNTQKYIVEREKGNSGFVHIGEVIAEGKDSSEQVYTYVDEMILDTADQPISYRIIRETDQKIHSYSKIVDFSSTNEENTKINIFPNPTSEFVHVHLLNYSDRGKISIYNKYKQILYQTSYENTSQIDIPVTDWEEGTYLLVISSGNSTLKEKLYIYH